MADLVVLAAVTATMAVVGVRLLGPPWAGLRAVVTGAKRRESLAAAHWAAVRHLDTERSTGERLGAVRRDAAVGASDAKAALDLARSLRPTDG